MGQSCGILGVKREALLSAATSHQPCALYLVVTE